MHRSMLKDLVNPGILSKNLYNDYVCQAKRLRLTLKSKKKVEQLSRWARGYLMLGDRGLEENLKSFRVCDQ